MASRIEIRPQARQDIIESATHIGFDNAVAANRFLDATEETFSFLSDFPQAGGKCLTKLKQLLGLRVFRIRGFPNHIICYLAKEDHVEIIRVLHGARDLKEAMRDD